MVLVGAKAAGGLGRQPSAAFGAAALEDKSPGFGRHASTETVGARALDLAGLKCAFHGLSRAPSRGKNWVYKTVRAGPRSWKGGKGTQMAPECQ